MEISVGTRIRKIRGTESRASFADKFGIGTTTLQRYENDERSPELDFLMRLQSATGYSLDYLVYGKDSFLPSDEKLLLDKYRQASPEIKNKMLMLLLSGETTNSVVNSPVNSGKGNQYNGTNQTINNAAPAKSKDINGDVSIKAKGKRAQAAFNIKNE